MVPSLKTAIQVIHEIASNSGETSSSALARKVDASQPTTYRILKTLEDADWIRANPSGGYSLSMGLLPLLQHLDDFSRYGRAAKASLDALSSDLNLTVKLSVRQSLDQIIVGTAEPVRPWGVSVPLGGRFPIVWGSPGACLLSDLNDPTLEAVIEAIPAEDWKHENPEQLRRRIKEVHETGLCESLGEHYLGLDTMSAPVKGKLLTQTTITLVGFKGEMTDKSLPKLRDRLLKAAQELEVILEES